MSSSPVPSQPMDCTSVQSPGLETRKSVAATMDPMEDVQFSESTSEPLAIDPTFTCFPHLPLELREEIWRFALRQPRVHAIVVEYGKKGELVIVPDFMTSSKWSIRDTNRTARKLLRLCREARRTAITALPDAIHMGKGGFARYNAAEDIIDLIIRPADDSERDRHPSEWSHMTPASSYGKETHPEKKLVSAFASVRNIAMYERDFIRFHKMGYFNRTPNLRRVYNIIYPSGFVLGRMGVHRARHGWAADIQFFYGKEQKDGSSAGTFCAVSGNVGSNVWGISDDGTPDNRDSATYIPSRKEVQAKIELGLENPEGIMKLYSFSHYLVDSEMLMYAFGQVVTL